MRVLIDCDGVLADFVGHLKKVCRLYSHVTEWDLDKCLTQEELTRIAELRHEDNGFCKNIPWLPGACTFLDLCVFSYDTYIVTSAWNLPGWERDRRKWLKGYVGSHKIIFSPKEAKPLIKGDVLIEDHPGTCYKWLEEHKEGKAILLDAPWNQENTRTFKEHGPHPRMIRSHTYDDVYDLLERRFG